MVACVWACTFLTGIMTGVEDYDVVVVGAGLYGIQAARTYLEIHPLAKVTILEADEVVGGVWSESK